MKMLNLITNPTCLSKPYNKIMEKIEILYYWQEESRVYKMCYLEQSDIFFTY